MTKKKLIEAQIIDGKLRYVLNKPLTEDQLAKILQDENFYPRTDDLQVTKVRKYTSYYDTKDLELFKRNGSLDISNIIDYNNQSVLNGTFVNEDGSIYQTELDGLAGNLLGEMIETTKHTDTYIDTNTSEFINDYSKYDVAMCSTGERKQFVLSDPYADKYSNDYLYNRKSIIITLSELTYSYPIKDERFDPETKVTINTLEIEPLDKQNTTLYQGQIHLINTILTSNPNITPTTDRDYALGIRALASEQRELSDRIYHPINIDNGFEQYDTGYNTD